MAILVERAERLAGEDADPVGHRRRSGDHGSRTSAARFPGWQL